MLTSVMLQEMTQTDLVLIQERKLRTIRKWYAVSFTQQATLKRVDTEWKRDKKRRG